MSQIFESGLSRRTFMTAAAAAAASLAARPILAQQAPLKKLGFALVGVGGLTMGQLLPAFARCKYARPVALVSGSPDKANQQAGRYSIDPKNVYNYQNFDTIKDNPDVDVVYVVLPNSMHAEYTIRAAKAGKHVLCEKPMANTVEECQAMIAACAQANKKLMIAYRMRYEPMTIEAIRVARSAADMGAIKQITAEAGFNIGDPNQWRLNKALAGGGSLMDIGIYALNAIRYLSGQEPSEVTAMSYSTADDPRFKEVEEAINFEMKFPSGFIGNVVSTYGYGCSRFRVYGTRGQIESEPFQSYSGNKLFITRGRTRQEFAYEQANHFAAEMDHMSECIQTNKTPLTPGEEGLKDLEIMMAAYQSAREGKSIKLV